VNKTIVRLVDGIVNVDPRLIKEPSSSPSPIEVIIGELNDPELQQFYAYQHQLGEEARKKIKSIRDIPALSDDVHDPKKCPQCQALMGMTLELEYSKAVSDLFWSAVSSSISSEGMEKVTKIGGMGIRKGWKIVAVPNENPLLSGAFQIPGGMMFRF
jgi:hypothetical protein